MVVGGVVVVGFGCVGCYVAWGQWGCWCWALVVWLGDLVDHGAERGSSILPSVVRSSWAGRACEERQGRYRLGLSGRFGIGAAGELPGAAGRWVLCGLGHIGSRHSRVAIGGGFG